MTSLERWKEIGEKEKKKKKRTIGVSCITNTHPQTSQLQMSWIHYPRLTTGFRSWMKINKSFRFYSPGIIPHQPPKFKLLTFIDFFFGNSRDCLINTILSSSVLSKKIAWISCREDSNWRWREDSLDRKSDKTGI